MMPAHQPDRMYWVQGGWPGRSREPVQVLVDTMEVQWWWGQEEDESGWEMVACYTLTLNCIVLGVTFITLMAAIHYLDRLIIELDNIEELLDD